MASEYNVDPGQGYRIPSRRRRRRRRRRQRPRGLNTVQGARGPRYKRPIGPPAPGRARPGPFPHAPSTKRRTQIRLHGTPAYKRALRRLSRQEARQAGRRALIATAHVPSGGLRIGPVNIPAPIADVADDAVDFVKGGGVPGVVVRHLGPVAKDAAENVDDVAKELVERLESVYGGGGKKFKRSDIKGPPAPGRKAPGPFLRGSEKGAAGLAASVPTVSGGFASKAAIGTGLALSQDPKGTLSGTARGTLEMLTGLAGLAGEAVKDPSVLKRLPGQALEDINRRYSGPLEESVERIKKEGAAAELMDLAILATGAGGIVGRTAGSLARAGKLGPRALKIATERPRLQVTGDRTVRQDVHPNLIRASRQAAKDRRRQRRTATRLSRYERDPDRKIRGLVPEGERVTVEPSFLERKMGGRAQQVSREVVVPQTLRGQAKAERLDIARLAGIGQAAFRQERHGEISKGFRREFAQLSRKQRPAAWHVAQGLVDPTDEARAVSQLKRRQAQLADVSSASWRGKSHNERALVDHLIEHSSEIFGGKAGAKLAEFQRRAADRSIRLETLEADEIGSYGALTAEARRLRPQGETLGVRFPEEAIDEANDLITTARAAGDDARVARAQALKADAQRGYIREVREKAADAGENLPEPAFVTHEKRGFAFSPHALGGARAVQGVRETSFRLFREGRANVSPQAVEHSIALSIKRRHNWKLVADQAEAASVRVGADDIANARIFKEVEGPDGAKVVPKNADELSIDELRTVLDRKGLDHRDYAFWNPGRMRRTADKLIREGRGDELLEDIGDGILTEKGAGTGLRDAVVDSMHEAHKSVPDKYALTKGWRVIPRAAHDEIMAATKPSGAVGRGIGKVQGFQSRILLGLSPSWLQMQVASNVLLTAGAVRGNVLAFVKSPVFWMGVPKEIRDAVDRELGSSVLAAHGAKIRFGRSVDRHPVIDGMVAVTDGISNMPVFKQLRDGVQVNVPVGRGRRATANVPVNPIEAMFGLDAIQNRYFRRVVLYNEIKRQAFRDMGDEVGLAVRAQEQLAGIMRLGPRERMEALLKNPEIIEQHARHVDNWLGDYTKFTANERRILKRSIMFYGFLRHSTRLLFYTLPVKHPLALAVAGKMTQLRNEEVRELLGGDAVPWAFSRVYIDGRTGNVASRDTPNQDLRSIDLYRLNPVTNAVIEGLEDPSQLTGLISPLAQATMNQIYSTRAFTGRGFQIEGSAAEAKDLPLWSPQRLQIFANEMLSTAYPYRKAMSIRAQGHSQADDALLWHMEPMHYKTAESRARERQRIRDRRETNPLTDVLPLLGLVDAGFAKRDRTRLDVRRMREERRAGSGSSGGSSGGWGSAGSSGGGWGSASGSP